jgi:hypothetical protein
MRSVLALAGLGLLMMSCGGRGSPATVSSEALSVEGTVELPGEPGAILIRPDAVWVTQPDGLVRVSIQRERITRRVRLGMVAYDIVAGHGSLWAVGMVKGRERVTREGRYPVIHLVRVEPRTGRVLARVPLPARSNGNRLAVTRRNVWITDPAEGPASRIFAVDPVSHRVQTLPSGEEPLALVPDRGRVWSVNHDDGTLRAQDANSARTVASIRLPGEPHGLVLASGSVWVADGHNARVLQVDPDSLEIVSRVDLSHETGPLAPAGRGGVWATAPWQHAESVRLWRIDPEGRVVESVSTGSPIIDFATRGRTLWIATTGSNRLLRVPE